MEFNDPNDDADDNIMNKRDDGVQFFGVLIFERLSVFCA